jgi:hypothetical protein
VGVLEFHLVIRSSVPVASCWCNVVMPQEIVLVRLWRLKDTVHISLVHSTCMLYMGQAGIHCLLGGLAPFQSKGCTCFSNLYISPSASSTPGFDRHSQENVLGSNQVLGSC